ncbi:DUF2637 domain-containing protein [Streptomyces sp. BBFR2]|uniref:DUF2637 domain-containing protein n=1 Tax=Streptomyces sp. BBFR2 TaxID=3372854 RepID=UPI0037DA3EAF
MSTMNTPKPAHINGWDRAVVISLGGAACALSYDALQQMALAIHIRGFLTYLFPLVIDGFVAYGVRTLLVLRAAPMRSRVYVWTLFGTATAASIWANALHAVRLNEEAVAGTGLRLGDTVVAVLSTIAPLALAGAVHLYILIARGPVKGSGHEDLGHHGRGHDTENTRTDRAGQQQQLMAGRAKADQPVTTLTGRPRLPLDKPAPDSRSLTGDSIPADSRPFAGGRDQPDKAADLPGEPDTTRSVTDRTGDTAPATGGTAPATGGQEGPTQVPAPPVTDRASRTPGDQRPDPDTEELLKIARSAARAEDKLTRKVVAQAIRGQQIPLSNDTLTTLMVQLREQHGQQAASARN